MNRLPTAVLLSGVVVALVSPSVRAANPQAVNRAVERGEKALRAMQRTNGTWPYSEIGATALAGLTLLECGAAADDPAVARAAEEVRRASVDLTHNYSIALAILFLDRLADPGDIPLIESLTVRLLAGQTATGGWNYNSPPVPAAEVRRLQSALEARKDPAARREAPRPGAEKRTAKDLPTEIRQQLADLDRAVDRKAPSDNSNTQFATLALWVGRRYGLPVEPALKRVEARFRASQNPDGGWGYYDPGAGRKPTGVSTASMTCAGLLGLAVAEAETSEAAGASRPGARAPRDLTKDAHLSKGLLALGTAVGPSRGGSQPKGTRTIQVPRAGGRTYYFLWSLERVAVALDLKTISKKDWYNWGAEILLANQQPGGAWQGSYGDSGADTCFALLFLKRANLVPDLTAQITGKVKDPAERTLTGGGVGGEALLGGSVTDLKPGIEDRDARPGADGKYAASDSGRKEARPTARPIQEPPTVVKPTETVKPADTAVGRMAAELVRAAGSRHTLLLQQMRDGRGADFTAALATAIPQLTGARQQKARDALVERLTRMKADTLLNYLGDEEPEIRRAAALASAQKENKAAAPKLIPLLRDPNGDVARAAHEALKSLSGRDFGPARDAGREDREQSVRAWLDWWNKQEGK